MEHQALQKKAEEENREINVNKELIILARSKLLRVKTKY